MYNQHSYYCLLPAWHLVLRSALVYDCHCVQLKEGDELRESFGIGLTSSTSRVALNFAASSAINLLLHGDARFLLTRDIKSKRWGYRKCAQQVACSFRSFTDCETSSSECISQISRTGNDGDCRCFWNIKVSILTL
jgi:hypothetical protein